MLKYTVASIVALWTISISHASQSPRLTITSLMDVADESSAYPSPRCSPRGMEAIDFFDYDDVIATPRDNELEQETGLHEGPKTQQALLKLHMQQSKKLILTSRGWRYLAEEPDGEAIEIFKGIADEMLLNVHEGMDVENLFSEPFGKEVRYFKIPDTDSFMVVYRSVIFAGIHKGKALSLFLQEMVKKLVSEAKEGEDPGLPKSISMTDDNENYLWQIEQELDSGLKGIMTRLYHFKITEDVVEKSEDQTHTQTSSVTDSHETIVNPIEGNI